MRLSKQGKLRIISITALAVIFALIISLGRSISPKGADEAAGTAGIAVVYAGDTEYYKLMAGDKDIAIFESEAKAQEVISLVKSKYVDVRARNPVVTLTPELKVEKITVAKSAEQPQINTNPQAVMREITAGDAVVKTYTVKAGDTLWGIAEANNKTVEDIEKINPDLDVDHIIEGEEIIVSSESPQQGIIKVKVEYEESKEVPVEYKTVYEEDPEMDDDEEEILKTEGKEGKARIIEKVTAINGVIGSRTEISKTEILKPVNEVIVRGSKPDSEDEEENAEEGSEEDFEEDSEESSEDEYSQESEESSEESAEESYEDEYSERSAEASEESAEESYEDEYSQESEESSEESYEEEYSEGSEEASEESSEDGYSGEESTEDYSDSENESWEESSGDDYTEPEPTSANDNQEETFRDPSENEDYEMPDESSGDLGYSSSGGQAIVDYAMQFIGNPYVWGGTSLTNGCDCSGFIYSVFNDCGYGISRWPDDDYPHLSASELQPGDICVYGHHYAIYIGNGMEISAINEAQGINTHPMYYSTSGFMYGLRIVQ